MQELIFEKILNPYFQHRDGFNGINKYVKEIDYAQKLSFENIQKYQLKKLKRLVSCAYENTDYYRKIMDQSAIRPESIKSLEDILKLPILTKETISKNYNQLISNNLKKKEIIKYSSGGTTGFITNFCMTKDELVPKIASIQYFDKKAGHKFGYWMSLVWPATLDYKINKSIKSKIRNYFSTRTSALYAFEMNEKIMEEHIMLMRKYNIGFIRAFPTPLVCLSEYIKNKSIDMPNFRGIVTTGEILCEKDKTFIQEVFNCPVYNSYRTREVGLIAQECDKAEGLHVNVSNIYLESIDSREGQKQLLVTDLTNFTMPFIRYQIGDLGEIQEQRCSCGRWSPRIKELGGRIADVTYSPDGKKISSITLIPNVIHASGIKNRVQIIQESYTEFRILIEGEVKNNEILKIQTENMEKIYGKNIYVKHEIVNKIPFLESGKYQFIKCNIHKKVN
ncbi:MAG: hypothetical protein SCI25_13665 [Desulfuromonadales bacterium]|nr:hypothetical protein [Desulfuromonadales bacterium]